MKFADSIKTHVSASVGPDVYTTIKKLGVKTIDGNRSRVRSGMVLLIAAGHVQIVRKNGSETAMFQYAPSLTPKVVAAAHLAAKRIPYNKLTPKLTRAEARKILKEYADHREESPGLD